jgi:hypothetical protein
MDAMGLSPYKKYCLVCTIRTRGLPSWHFVVVVVVVVAVVSVLGVCGKMAKDFEGEAFDALTASGFTPATAARIGVISEYSSKLIIEHLRVLTCVGCGKLYRTLYSAGWRECVRHPLKPDSETGIWPCCSTRSRATLTPRGILFPLDRNDALYHGCTPCDHHDHFSLRPAILPNTAYLAAVKMVASSEGILSDGPIGNIHAENTKKMKDLLKDKGYLPGDYDDVIVVSSS